MMTFNKQAGFTLLEVLIAVTITALIGIGASQLLSGVANTKGTTEERSQILTYMQRMDTFLRKDFWQLSGRETKDVYGQLAPAITTTGDYLIEFTHSGISTDLIEEIKTSNMQRTAYAIRSHSSDYCKDAQKPIESDGNCFIRFFWPVLDLTAESEPLVQVILDDIEEVKIYFKGGWFDSADPSQREYPSEWQEAWPPVFMPQGHVADLVQVKLTLEINKYGKIERIYEVPRYAQIMQ
jgi:general secretion pathway protein J